MMGSPTTEPGRSPDESPVHSVHIGYALAISTYPVTVGEFSYFVHSTGYHRRRDCEAYDRERPGPQPARDWQRPGFAQTDAHPVTCMAWSDARAYLKWLSGMTGKHYRLLSESEYEYAARGGSVTAFFWGSQADVGHANCDGCGGRWDGRSTSPVGSFAPNGFGLYDFVGNVWSWTADCWSDYSNTPGDGSASGSLDCRRRVLRGGSWYFPPRAARSAERYWIDEHSRFYDVGFRVARLP